MSTIHRSIYEKQRAIEHAHSLQTHTTGCFVYIHHFPRRRKRWPEQLSTGCLSETITYITHNTAECKFVPRSFKLNQNDQGTEGNTTHKLNVDPTEKTMMG